MKFEYNSNDINETDPLIYLWSLSFGDRTRKYVGKAIRGSKRPLTQYSRNVKNLLSGKPYRKGNPNGFRLVHRAMADCVRDEGKITLRLLENVDPDQINVRERELIQLHNSDLNGTPSPANHDAMGDAVEVGDKPHQRLGAESNTAVGRAFEELARRVLAEHGLNLDMGHNVDIGVGAIKKPRDFDLGSADPAVIVECKAMRWTSGGNAPSAKLRTMEKEMYCFHIAPAHYRKILFVERSTRDGYEESLAEYFVRLKCHLIPADVEIWEYDHGTQTVQVLP